MNISLAKELTLPADAVTPVDAMRVAGDFAIRQDDIAIGRDLLRARGDGFDLDADHVALADQMRHLHGYFSLRTGRVVATSDMRAAR